MSDNLYLATTNGLFGARRDGGTWSGPEELLEGRHVTSVVADDGLILAGTKNGILRSVDKGKDWGDVDDNSAIGYVRWLSGSPGGASLLLAGTEPALIFVSRDRGDSWKVCPEVSALRDTHGWFLPYSTEAGCVRGFAIAESAEPRVFAAVEVGGALVSKDSGDSWELVDGSDGNPDMSRPLGTLIHPDVHSITVHLSIPDIITAPTGGGLYRSNDGGTTWYCLYTCYCRATWVNPNNSDHIIFGPADGVSRNGRIEESRDGGQTWQSASTGMQVPWSQHMVERFVPAADELLAVLSNGELWSAGLEKMKWQRILEDVSHVTSVAAG
jgi:hypothetical protein